MNIIERRPPPPPRAMQGMANGVLLSVAIWSAVAALVSIV